MNKAPNHPFALGAFALSFAALLTVSPGQAAEPVAESGTPAPLAEELKPLQCQWEGEGTGGKVTVTITGNSLRFHRDTNFWFDTTITVPAGTDPKQLHATIKDCPPSQADSIGKVVGAIFKIENQTLTLADYAIPGEPPKTFADATSRYVLKKVQPQKRRPKHPHPNELKKPCCGAISPAMHGLSGIATETVHSGGEMPQP